MVYYEHLNYDFGRCPKCNSELVGVYKTKVEEMYKSAMYGRPFNPKKQKVLYLLRCPTCNFQTYPNHSIIYRQK